MLRPAAFTALAALIALAAGGCHLFMKKPAPLTAKEFRNGAGMRMLRIEPGSFTMGQAEGGNADERPAHKVLIGKQFYMAATEVTNAQYEKFDPAHKRFRGARGLSQGDDEAVVFVSWGDASAYCRWLTRQEGRPYRLPTEAEWEYACRAGTTTPYSTGDKLPMAYWKAQEQLGEPRPVSLRVADTPPNPWGLCEMHGGVEEWCLDWYGPYPETSPADPVGRADGIFRVTRGGSHNTPVAFLRSANRQGTLPEDKSWLIGFRVVLGEAPLTLPQPPAPPKPWAEAVGQASALSWAKKPYMDRPSFAGPIPFVRQPANPEAVPFYKHNHCPALTWCDNGDLLAAWFSTPNEVDRDMTILASRLRAGNVEWDEPSEFFKAPDRNMTGSALLNDGRGTLYHFNGIEAAGTWNNLALAMRWSTDNGATWTRPALIGPEHRHRHQVIAGAKVTREGFILQPCDAAPGPRGGTVLHISRDRGVSWEETGLGWSAPVFAEGRSGGWIAGIHAGVEQLADGSLLALGRGDEIGGRMPLSHSTTMGKTWTYRASPFPPIAGGQRLALLRLREGPLLLLSFTDSSANLKQPKGLAVRDAAGREHRFYGLFAALSSDEGRTWPVMRPVTAGDPPRTFNGGAWTGEFTMDATHAEPKGYLAATQSPDGMIHLVSSALYYRFNLAWLRQAWMERNDER